MRVLENNSIAIPRGDSGTIKVACTLKIPGEDWSAKQFEDGDTVYLTVKSSIHTEAIILQKVCTEFVEGKAIIELEPADTKGIKYGKYFYDVQLITKDDDVITIIKYHKDTRFIVEGEVTYDSVPRQ